MSHKYFLDSLLVIFVFLLQSSFISAFHFGLEFLLPVVILVLYYVLLVSLKRALFIGFLGGLLLGAYSSFMQGAELIALFVMIYIVWLLYSSVFTNRSIFSLTALIGIGVCLYDVMLYFIDLFYQFTMTDAIAAYYLPFIQIVTAHILINMFMMFIFFLILRSVDARFNTLRLQIHVS